MFLKLKINYPNQLITYNKYITCLYIFYKTKHISRFLLRRFLVFSPSEQYVPVISGSGKDISFLQCTSIIVKKGGIQNSLHARINDKSGDIATTASISFYDVNTGNLDCTITRSYMSLCYKEESQEKVATVSRTYLINVPETFLYECEAEFEFTTGELKTLVLEENIINDGKFYLKTY